MGTTIFSRKGGTFLDSSSSSSKSRFQPFLLEKPDSIFKLITSFSDTLQFTPSLQLVSLSPISVGNALETLLKKSYFTKMLKSLEVGRAGSERMLKVIAQ